MRDIANAFPSVDHATLDATIDQSADGKVATILKARHGTMQVRIRTSRDTELIIQPGCGGAQGDGVMPAVFRETSQC